LLQLLSVKEGKSMGRTYEEAMADALHLFRQLADDWEYGGDITPQTYLFADMGLQSLDVVVLAISTQERYGQVLPFPDLFADMGQRGIRDISVGEWVDFVYAHLNDASGKAR
jgi:acyl carrier protein